MTPRPQLGPLRPSAFQDSMPLYITVLTIHLHQKMYLEGLTPQERVRRRCNHLIPLGLVEREDVLVYPGVQLPSGVADLLQGTDQLGPRRGYMALTMFRVASSRAWPMPLR